MAEPRPEVNNRTLARAPRLAFWTAWPTRRFAPSSSGAVYSPGQ